MYNFQIESNNSKNYSLDWIPYSHDNKRLFENKHGKKIFENKHAQNIETLFYRYNC